MEAKAQAKFVRIAPRKVRIVMDLIRGKNLGEAITILRFVPKKASGIIEKVLRSAAANAEHNYDMNKDDLYVYKAYADEGPTLKRFMPRALGRATRIRKRTSHITVILREREGD
ncbi:MAG: 50S ribosomal protein L22 [Firmicutes bacterium]|jgi:large subunit ribosomal protein L22|nr:50S ribosomal protein L22 [Bacillota bacterium]